MLHFYGWATPNSQRVSIMLEECGLEYAVSGVNIRARQQFAPEILALNPYGKIPILVEQRPGGVPLVLFEGGAILPQLAQRHGVLLPRGADARAEVLAWLMVALTSLGPFTGQAHHWAERRLLDTPHLAAWFTRIGTRPAVQRGMAVPAGAKLA